MSLIMTVSLLGHVLGRCSPVVEKMRTRKETCRETCLVMLGWDMTVENEFGLGSLPGSDVGICGLGLGWDSDRTRTSLVLMIVTN